MIKVAINGFGRIGRLCFRLMEENPEFEVVVIIEIIELMRFMQMEIIL